MGLKGVGGGGVNWIHPSLDGYTWGDVIHTLMNLQFPRNSENFLKGRESRLLKKNFVPWNKLCVCVCVCVST